jgi:cytochrome c oxidase assembly factor CtaG
MSYWNFEPSVVIGTSLLSAFYALAVGPLRRRFHLGTPAHLIQQLAFYLGTLCMILALIGPLDVLGDEYLFSAHMAQHMILSFLVPPLWVLGTPSWLIRCLVPRSFQSLIWNPIFAFLFFNGVMWIWHIPAVYDTALVHEGLHITEHLIFMAAGVVGFLPVLKSDLIPQMTPQFKLIYLFPSMLSCTALAALVTLSSVQLYSFYGNAAMQWHLTALEDQQIGGASMWVPGDMLYMGLILWAFNKFLDTSNTERQQVKV